MLTQAAILEPPGTILQIQWRCYEPSVAYSPPRPRNPVQIGQRPCQAFVSLFSVVIIVGLCDINVGVEQDVS